MARRSRGATAATYVLEGDDLAEVVDLVQALKDRGVDVPDKGPTLTSSDGRTLELPGPIFEALHQVLSAMALGQAVTIIPQNKLLTTQEAADFLGVSRPTLVKMLEAGELPYELRGRHRRIRLADLLDYQEASRRERDEALVGIVSSGEQAGIYEKTAGSPPVTR